MEKENKPENKIHINTNTKYFLAQYNAVPWNAFQHLDWLCQQRATPQIEHTICHNIYAVNNPPPAAPHLLYLHPLLATVTGQTVHIRQQHQSSDILLTQMNNTDARSLFLPNPVPMHEHGNLTQCALVYVIMWSQACTAANLVILKYMAHPSIKIVNTLRK